MISILGVFFVYPDSQGYGFVEAQLIGVFRRIASY